MKIQHASEKRKTVEHLDTKTLQITVPVVLTYYQETQLDFNKKKPQSNMEISRAAMPSPPQEKV